MISYSVYNFIHILGIILVTLSLGVTMVALQTAKRPRWAMALQGIGLFLILLGGFGMAARMGMVRDFPLWLQGKVAFWIVVGFMPLVLRYFKSSLKWIVAAQIVFVLLAASFGIFKPWASSL